MGLFTPLVGKSLLNLLPDKKMIKTQLGLSPKNLIDRTGLRKREIAQLLFPDRSHPTEALYRVLNGKTLLNSDQLLILADLLDCTVNDLYNGSEWVAREPKNDLLVLETSRFRSELDTNTFVVKIYDKDVLFFEHAVVHKTITLTDYIKFLNQTINKQRTLK